LVVVLASVAGCGSAANQLEDTTNARSTATSVSASTANPSKGGTDLATGSASGSTSNAAVPVSAAYLVPGVLGDNGFLDSGEAGMKRAQAELGVTTKTVEGGVANVPAWIDGLTAFSGGDYDVVVTGGAQVIDQLTSVAAKFPQQSYIMFDAAIPAPNIASITFRQNDVAFQAGVLAASVSADAAHYPLATGKRNVGVIGGQNISAINDFIVGFEAGAKAVDPATTVQKSYVGSFADTNAAYNQATGMFANGADVVFAVAGGSGLGVLKAAADSNRYAIGVDSDQNELYPGHVLASALKNVGTALFDLLDLKAHGKLQMGHTYVYGIANDGVQLKMSDLVTPETADTVAEFSDKVATGQIDVPCVEPFCAEPSR
jgi:basic membrane protein A